MVTLVALGAALGATRAVRAQSCIGDCDGDADVSISELIRGVRIALGLAPVSNCSLFDRDGNGGVSVAELIAAVRVALDGCDGAATPTIDVQPTATPTLDPNETLLDRALRLLSGGNLRGAHEALSAAIAEAPDDESLNFYFAMTRIAIRVLDDPRLAGLLQRGGISIRGDSAHVCDLAIELPDEVPEGAPRMGEILDTVTEVLRPEVLAALENIDRVSATFDVRFALSHLPSCVCPPTDAQIVDLDRADVLALRAGLQFVAGLLDALNGYHLDFDLKAAADTSAKQVFDGEPGLGILRSAENLATARTYFDSALETALSAIDSMRAEQDDQADDVWVILPGDSEEADKFKLVLRLMREGLFGEVTLPVDVVTGEIVLMDIGLLSQERLNLNPFFSAAFDSLRSFVPLNEEGDLDSGRFPDPTFGGTVPDLTQEKIDNFLSEAEF